MMTKLSCLNQTVLLQTRVNHFWKLKNFTQFFVLLTLQYKIFVNCLHFV